MDNAYKNIGIAFGLVPLVDKLSLTKISSSMNGSNNIYMLSSKDKQFSFSINPNDKISEEQSLDILQNTLDYAYTQLTHEKDVQFDLSNDTDFNESIVKVINELKNQAKEIYYKVYSKDQNKSLDGKKEIANLEKRLYTFQDTFYSPTASDSTEYEIFECSLSFLDEIYGMQPLNPNAVFKDSTIWTWQDTMSNAEYIVDSMQSEPKLDEFLEEYPFDEDNTVEESEELSKDDMTVSDYKIYLQAKREYDKDLSLFAKLQKDQAKPSAMENFLASQMIDDLYDRMGDEMPSPTFFKYLLEKANNLFGNDTSKNSIERLNEILNDNSDTLDNNSDQIDKDNNNYLDSDDFENDR